MRIIIWGMGGMLAEHRIQIEEYSNKNEIIAFTDSSCNGSELLWSKFKTIKCTEVKAYLFDYLCIVSRFEWDIRKKIHKEEICEQSKIITYSELVMISELDLGLIESYLLLERTLPERLAEIIQKKRNYRYLLDKYCYVLFEEKYKSICFDKIRDIDDDLCPIWIYWDTGIQNAPEVVKKCVDSIEKAIGSKDRLFILDSNSVFLYISLPDYIIDKWKKGIISSNKFANIIRLHLLNVYGGIWIDSTVYSMKNRLPDYLRRNKLFMYHIDSAGLNSADPHMAANWLIAAHGESLILRSLEALHYEYWKHEDTECNYFFFHLLLSMAANYYQEEWQSVEVVLRDPAQMLCRYLWRKYDKDLVNDIADGSSIQKLSWKLPFDSYGDDSIWNYL